MARITGSNLSGVSITAGGDSEWIPSMRSVDSTGADTAAKPRLVKRVASSTGANADTLKTSAGSLTAFWGVSTAGFLRYLQIYDKASAPVIGTDTPLLTYPLPANAAFDRDIPNGGLSFTNGIAFAFTVDGTGTSAATSGDVVSFAMIGA